MDPTLIKAWNKGRAEGKKEATEDFYQFLIGRMESLTELDGVGKKTAFKIQTHFLQAFAEEME